MNTNKELSPMPLNEPIYLQIINKYFKKHKIPKNEFRVSGKYKNVFFDNSKDVVASENYFVLETTNRLLIAKHKNKLAKKLNKANYSVYMDRNWLFIKNVSEVSYIFKIFPATSNLPTFHDITICNKKDERAGQALYKYIENCGFPPFGNSSYEWKKYGFKVKLYSKPAIKTLKMVYKKCKIIVDNKNDKCYSIKIKFQH